MEDDAILVTLPLPSTIEAPQKLSDRINSSTRSIHAQLNRLILARLPLALPPYTLQPATYTSGLLSIAPIYITFESLWQTIIDTPPQPAFSNRCCCDDASHIQDSTGAFDDQTAQIVPSRIHSLLKHIHLPGLLREKRLRADISTLSGIHASVVDEQLRAVCSRGELATFIAHTKRSVQEHPHVLLAYTWVLYMALFSGGRHLRAMLQSAGGIGAEFWTRYPSPTHAQPEADTLLELTGSVQPHDAAFHAGRSNEGKNDGYGRPPMLGTSSDVDGIKSSPQGLQFFNFDGEEDGEDIKIEYKKRLTESEHILTEKEKVDILKESQMIFEFMVGLIKELDQVMGTNQDDLESERLHRSFRTKMTSRDSLVVAQERLAKEKGDSEGANSQHLPSGVSLLRKTLPSLYTATKAHRRVSFDPHLTTLKGGDYDTRMSFGTTSLKTVMAALMTGFALLLAWWLVV